uniref:Uncharacterized protein n=1 Tax=viral metagenome TaxID=1070528 RepID=A0A6H1ZVM8_9ZZZZ
MKEIPKKDDQRTIKDRFSISSDELEDRMQRQKKYHEEPVQIAVTIMSEARDKVMRSLGMDTEQEDEDLRYAQQEALGIRMTQETREEMAGLMGWTIAAPKRGLGLVPIAWVGTAYLDSQGKCWCEIHWFQENRMEKFGGYKIIY